MIVIAICRESRVLRLLSFLSLSSAVPPLGFNVKLGSKFMLNPFPKSSRISGTRLRKRNKQQERRIAQGGVCLSLSSMLLRKTES